MSKWQKVKIKDVCTKGTSSLSLKDLNGKEGDFSVYGAAGLVKKINFYQQENKYLAIIKDGAGVGRLYRFDGKTSVLGTMQYIFPNNNIDYSFCYYALQSIDLKKYVNGAAIPHIYFKDYSQEEIPLPPMEEQKKIAAMLDAVSDLLTKQKQFLAEQDNLIQSTFYGMFGTPEINEKGFPMHKISEICELNPKKPRGIDDNTECSFIPMSAVSEDGELNLAQIKLYKDVKKGFTYFAENDVLFAKITPCMENGKGAIAKELKNKFGFGSTEFHVLRPLNDISNARWLFQITKFKKFRENAEKSMTGSAGQKRVPAGFFNNYFIPVPPLELQQKFATIAEQIESEKAKIKSAIAETQTLFNALMSEYFEE